MKTFLLLTLSACMIGCKAGSPPDMEAGRKAYIRTHQCVPVQDGKVGLDPYVDLDGHIVNPKTYTFWKCVDNGQDVNAFVDSVDGKPWRP